MIKRIFKSTGETLQFLLIFASLASCFTLVTSVGAKGIVVAGNQLEKHEELIDGVASNSGAVFVGLFLFNIVSAGAESVRQCREEEERELKAKRDREQREFLERKQKAELELQRKRQAEKERIQNETNAQCMKCDFYCFNHYLRCAVHPGLKHNCSDFEPIKQREPVKLEIIQPELIVESSPESRGYFSVSEFSHPEFLYCILVMQIDDFHEDYLCERALVARFDELHEDAAHEPAPWDAALALSLEQVTNLQERLKTLSGSDRDYFLQAINTFVMFS